MTNLYEHTFEIPKVNAKFTDVWSVDAANNVTLTLLTENTPDLSTPNVRAVEDIISKTNTGFGAPQRHVDDSLVPDVTAAFLDGKLHPLQKYTSHKGETSAEEELDNVVKGIIASRNPLRTKQRDGDTFEPTIHSYPYQYVINADIPSEPVITTPAEEVLVDDGTRTLREAIDAMVEAESTPSVDFTFGEDKYLNEALEYIKSTYKGHYSGKTEDHVQATEAIFSGGFGVGFCVGDIVKYALRFGKKEGYNRKDVLKIIHYAVMLLCVVDKYEKGE